MKQFNFSLNTLLQVKSHIFEKDALALASLQKKLHQLELRRDTVLSTLEEMIEASVTTPLFSKNVEGLRMKVALLMEEIERERKKITLCQKSLSDSLNKRKVVEKIKENEYALYQKECARIHETHHI